jgi:KaiC/GvpD/RAD55 family RecA-like ATPase
MRTEQSRWEAPAKSADGIAADQILDAGRLVERPESAFLSFPWPTLAQLAGSIPPGSVSIIGAFSGGGKTTFVSSLVAELLKAGKKIYVMALETTPDHFRTYLACQQLGIKPGDILSGESHRMPNGDALRQAVHAQIETQFEETWDTLRVSNEETINCDRLEQAFHEAFDWGADMVLVDHIDEIEPDSPSELFAESVRTVKRGGKAARRYQLKAFFTSQLNNDTARGNKLAKYQPPQVQHFYMGQHKIHVSHNVLGLFRPIRPRKRTETVDEYREALSAAKTGEIEPQSVLEQGRMGVNLVKSKFYGEREGSRISLGIQNGRVFDDPRSIEERYGI